MYTSICIVSSRNENLLVCRFGKWDCNEAFSSICHPITDPLVSDKRSCPAEKKVYWLFNRYVWILMPRFATGWPHRKILQTLVLFWYRGEFIVSCQFHFFYSMWREKSLILLERKLMLDKLSTLFVRRVCRYIFDQILFIQIMKQLCWKCLKAKS